MIEKRIFTFWEPRKNIPAYLELCIKTWYKFLPDYEIIILDYKTVDEWLGMNYFDKSLYKDFSLPMQADAIRCAILRKYGGIWLDTDTIMTSFKVKELLEKECEFFLINHHIGFIKARPEAKLLILWEQQILKNIQEKKTFQRLLNNFGIFGFILKIFCRKTYKKTKKWDFLGNGIINQLIDKKFANTKHFESVDRSFVKCFPETGYKEILKRGNAAENYRKFYFENDFSEEFLADKNHGGMVMLHNSWTPDKYKKMSEKEFLAQDITLSNMLKSILK